MDKHTAADLLDNLIGMVDDTQGNNYDTALKMGIEALKTDADLISRQAAIDGIESFRPIKPARGETSMEAVNRSAWDCAINCVESFIRTMPPSEQERKTGRWERKMDGVYCSACHKGWDFIIGVPKEVETEYNYCPHCGAKMDEVNNGSDK